jgi:hypothetical protein
MTHLTIRRPLVPPAQKRLPQDDRRAFGRYAESMNLTRFTLSLVVPSIAVLLLGTSAARTAHAWSAEQAPPAAPTAPAPPAAPARPGVDPDSVVPPPSADEANESLPEGLKVRDPGPKPNFKGGPAIYFQELDHHFGPMTNAETKHHRFSFVNAGDQPLKIEAVVPKCGCTRPNYERDKVYQPGESGWIDIDFTPPTGGHQAKAIVIKSNAAWPAEVFNIRVIGKVESVLSFQPKSYDFGEVRRGDKWEAEVKIVADAKATNFDSVGTRIPTVTGTFVGNGPHRGEVTLKINVDPKIAWGSLRGAVVFLNTSGKDDMGKLLTKSLPFRITGVLVDEIRADQYIFQMNTIRPGQPFKASVFLFHEDGKPIEVTDLVLAPMGVDSKGIAAVTYDPATMVQETRDGKPGYLITLSGTTPADSHGFFGGSVRFKTKTQGDAQPTERELPIGGRVMTEAAEKALPTAGGARR